MILKLNKKKLFCDIDNTVADQYDYYKKELKKNKKILIEKLDINKLKIIKHSYSSLKILNKYFDIYFLTARNPVLKKKTINWLNENKFQFKKIFFVKRHKDKIKFLEKKKPHLFIDDLKYDYETLKPKLMTKNILELKKKNIRFYIFNKNWKTIVKKEMRLQFLSNG